MYNRQAKKKEEEKREESYVPTPEEIQKMLGDEMGSHVLVESAQRFSKSLLAKKLQMDQVRTVFDELKKIENLWVWQKKESEALHRLFLLQPRLASRVKRVRGAELLYELVVRCVNFISQTPREKQKAAFLRFVEYMEAVVAYHKFYEPKEREEVRS